MAEGAFVELRGGLKMPILGYGTWQSQEDEIEKVLDDALEAGYRHIDTAFAYRNEAAIGRVLNRWLSSGKLKREELFIVTKLPIYGLYPEGVEKYLKRSLEALQLDHVDVYLIHGPFGLQDTGKDEFPFGDDGKVVLDVSTDLVAVWRAMERQVDAGLTKAIGVSNFSIRQIQKILDEARIPPANQQVELHLHYQQKELVEFCKKNGIVVTAYAPLGSPGFPKFLEKFGVKTELPNILSIPEVVEIAGKHRKTPAQVLLRHIIQKGIVAIPKSTNPERIRQNIDVFDFELDGEDVEKLDALDRGDDGRMFDFLVFKGIDEHPEYPFK